MNIELMMKSQVKNPTEFNKGDVIEFIGNQLSSTFLVVGEDDLMLHTFWIQNGDYLGINKNPHTDNLKMIRKI